MTTMIDQQALDSILDLYFNARDEESTANSEYRRGHALGRQYAINRTLKALGYCIVYDEDGTPEIVRRDND